MPVWLTLEQIRAALQNPPPGHFQKLSQLNDRANGLRAKFRQNGSVADLEGAITGLRAGLLLHPPGSDSSAYLNDLAGALWERYKHKGDLANLTEAIGLLDIALAQCSPDHPLRAETLNNLAICLQDRYTEQGTLADMDKAIETHEAALVLRGDRHPDRSLSLNNLALCLRNRFRKNGVTADLDKAIEHSRAALNLRPEGHHFRPSCQNNLAISLQDRFEKQTALADLEEAIELNRAALAQISSRHSDRPAVLYNLTLGLRHRFRQHGALADLNEAIELLKAAVDLQPPGHNARCSYIDTLASSLRDRFKQLAVSADLDEAMKLHFVIFELCPPEHSERARFLNNLASGLQDRHYERGALADLEGAITHHQAALKLRPEGHADRSSSLHNLACVLKIRFERSAAQVDLNEAITLHRAALALRPPGHSLRSSSLINLANCLRSRYEQQGQLADLDEAIELGKAGLALRPSGHSNRSISLKYLARSLEDKFEHTGVQAELDEAFELYPELSQPTQVISQFHLETAKAWASSAEKFHHNSGMAAYQTALKFLAQHAAILPSSVGHYHVLKRTVSSLAVDAFSYCVRKGALTTAAELLEQGRAVFWTHLARLRTPLDELSESCSDTDPSLAEEFKRLSVRLRNVFDNPTELQSLETRELTKQLDDIITRIRTSVPGFSRFLLPPQFSDLQKCARDGPVIVVNASRYACDALIILNAKDPVHVELAIENEGVSLLSSKFRSLVDKPERSDVRGLVIVLRDLWERVVEPIITVLEEHSVAHGSRIWWCPTAEFTSLPLHAAGPYRSGKPNLSDLYISSYTPTLAALQRARKQPDNASDTSALRSFLAVGTARPYGEVPLPAVSAELATVAERLSPVSSFSLLGEGDASVERVSEALNTCQWLHLACHGIPNQMQPFESSFALHDGRLTLKRIAQSDCQNPEFAFLSACRTTIGDDSTPDEVIHLAAAMQFSGFRSVIGTILSVDDGVAREVVSAFYEYLVDGSGTLDCTRAAIALHMASKKLKGKIPFDQQLVFVHIGI
ncbi:hypothetical protein HYDPIDRAFT_87222 [Hydnomerulius pinastri MD-312]|nr:hypothetical protein HYDPIDRAFT_87222 [Hydnomerulius pinastri MD-312]